jgi:hypothetical protein
MKVFVMLFFTLPLFFRIRYSKLFIQHFPLKQPNLNIYHAGVKRTSRWCWSFKQYFRCCYTILTIIFSVPVSRYLQGRYLHGGLRDIRTRIRIPTGKDFLISEPFETGSGVSSDFTSVVFRMISQGLAAEN